MDVAEPPMLAAKSFAYVSVRLLPALPSLVGGTVLTFAPPAAAAASRSDGSAVVAACLGEVARRYISLPGTESPLILSG